MHELPLVGRNFYTLAVLTPGVTGLPSGGGQAYAQASADIFNGEYGVNINANGLRSEQNEFTVDGVSVTSMVRGGVANINPSADSVQELRVSVNTYSAEYGGAGAHVDVITKSGSNKFHGNADWFMTDHDLQAKNDFRRACRILVATNMQARSAAPFVMTTPFSSAASMSCVRASPTQARIPSPLPTSLAI